MGHLVLRGIQLQKLVDDNRRGDADDLGNARIRTVGYDTVKPNAVPLPFYLTGRWSLCQVLRISGVVNPMLRPYGATLRAINVTNHNDTCQWYIMFPCQVATMRPVPYYVR